MARWLAGDFELVVSEWLLAELGRALAYPTLRARISPEEADEFVSLLAPAAILAPDSSTQAGRSADPDDDYLIALAGTTQSLLVSGDRHLLELADELPIQTARAFLDLLERASARP